MGAHLARVVLGILDGVTVAQAGVFFCKMSRAGQRHLRVTLCLAALAGLVLALTVLFGLGWYAGIGVGFTAGYWTARREHGTDSPRAGEEVSGGPPHGR